MAACTNHGHALQYASRELQNDREVVLTACRSTPCAIKHASRALQNDKYIVLTACRASLHHGGFPLMHASASLRANKEVVFTAFESNTYSFGYARGGINLEELHHDKEFLQNSTNNYLFGDLKYQNLRIRDTFNTELWDNKDYVMGVCAKDGNALQYASPELQNDQEVVLKACSQDSSALQYASPDLRNNKEVVLKACSNPGDALLYASWELRNDKDFLLKACQQNRDSLKYAPRKFLDEKEFILMTCSQDGKSIQYASQRLQDNKEAVLAACSQDGIALQYASRKLRTNKEVVLAAVASKPAALKFALGGLNQDKDCLIKARLWDEDHQERTTNNVASGTVEETKKKKIVLSTKFSLAAKSSDHATRFTLELKRHPYIAGNNFAVYSPNAFNKSTCDPQWTNPTWPCRGTISSCKKPSRTSSEVPIEAECCWRYSFRYHLMEASRLDGFMIQVVDWNQEMAKHTLGDGQRIENEMAGHEGTKIFRFYEPLYSYASLIDELILEIQKWYDDGCRDVADCNVPPTADAKE